MSPPEIDLMYELPSPSSLIPPRTGASVAVGRGRRTLGGAGRGFFMREKCRRPPDVTAQRDALTFLISLMSSGIAFSHSATRP